MSKEIGTVSLAKILEAIFFVSETPLSPARLKELLPEFDLAAIRQTCESLLERYNNEDRGFRLVQVADGYHFRTRPEVKEYLGRLIKIAPVKLSRAALETLALIAYRQPIIRSEIEHVRGVDVSSILRQLLERRLIKVVGRKDLPGKPLIYGTTRRFLEVFELKDIKDLPTLKEVEDLKEPGAGTPMSLFGE